MEKKQATHNKKRNIKFFIALAAVVLLVTAVVVPAAFAETSPEFTATYTVGEEDTQVEITWQVPAEAGASLALFAPTEGDGLEFLGLHEANGTSAFVGVNPAELAQGPKSYYVALTDKPAAALQAAALAATGQTGDICTLPLEGEETLTLYKIAISLEEEPEEIFFTPVFKKTAGKPAPAGVVLPGDTVEFSVTCTDSTVTMSGASIYGKDVSASITKSGNVWKVKYVFNAALVVEADKTLIPFAVEFENAAHEVVATFSEETDPSWQLYLYTPRTLKLLLYVDISEDATFAYAGNKIYLELTSSRSLTLQTGEAVFTTVLNPLETTSVALAGSSLVKSSDPNSDGTYTYIVSYTIPQTATYPAGGKITMQATLVDEYGNTIKLQQDGSRTVVFSVPGQSVDKLTITTPYKELTDPANPSSAVKRYFAREGTAVTIQFETNELLAFGVWYRPRYTFTIGSQSVILTQAGKGPNNVRIYKGTLILDQSSGLGPNSGFNYTLELKGVHKRYPSITVDRWLRSSSELPIAAPVVYLGEAEITQVELRSNESVAHLAKAGSKVTLTVTTNNGGTLTDATIGGVAATTIEQVGTAGNVWKAVVQLPVPTGGNLVPTGAGVTIAEDTNLEVEFCFEDYTGQQLLVNGSSLDYNNLPGAGSNQVKYFGKLYTDPAIETETNVMAPDYNNSSVEYLVVKNKDKIVISFTVGHPVQITQAKLGDAVLANSFVQSTGGQGGYTYTKELVVGSSALPAPEDLATMPLKLTVSDELGQTYTYDYLAAAQGSTDCVLLQYYAPIAISNVKIVSNNAKDPAKYAKNGDTITVTFTSNHFVAFTPTIAGHTASYSSKGGPRNIQWTFTYIIQGGEVENHGVVPFGFTATDTITNEPVAISNTSQGVQNSLKYYAPIEVSQASIASNNKNTGYAKNGDTITVDMATNNETIPVSASIGGCGAYSGDSHSLTPSVSYTIPAGENSMTEGVLGFAITLEDPAGNREEVSVATHGESQKVIYDRTSPVITIAPAIRGFTSEDVAFTMNYSDEYLDLLSVSYLLNGEEKIATGERGSEPVEKFSKTVMLTVDGVYTVSAKVQDKAGNEATFVLDADVVLDKTAPVVKLRLNRNTFQVGFTLEQLFEITEVHVEEVLCTVATLGGVEDWALEKPLEEEGKKTVSIIVGDMAKNVSVPIVCDIYIDGTAPQPVMLETRMGRTLSTGEEVHLLGTSAVLDISLNKLEIGDEDPDKFTVLQLLDEQGNLVHDFLAGSQQQNQFSYTLQTHGKYTLVAEAVDSVGNHTGRLEYKIVFRKRNVFEAIAGEYVPLAGFNDFFDSVVQNRLWLVITLPLLLVLGTVLITLAVRRRRKRKKQAE